tara:strand:- start:1010 stop:2488 length:1479 start_codon:yes stop_codon:yes gene_type:complete
MKKVYYETCPNSYLALPILYFASLMGLPVKYNLSRGFMYAGVSVIRRIVHVLLGPYRALWYPIQIRNKLSDHQVSEINLIYEDALLLINNKQELYDYSIDGVIIGDLIYDTYLRVYRKSTVDLDDNNFKLILKNSINLFVYWRDIARKNDSEAVIVTHACYTNAIPARAFIFNDKKAFQVNHAGVYRLSKSMRWAYNESFYFKELAKKISSKKLAEYKSISKERLALRFAGNVGVDMAYSTASAYTDFSDTSPRLIARSSNLKILVAAHCLFDAPNGYGDNLFLDFYEWLRFLAEMSNTSQHDWYIKTHPDFLPGNDEEIANIISDSSIVFLPSTTSHHKIISEGIDAVCTVYGTIGFEYAALGKTVINASIYNPHIAYDFNIHPKSIEEYTNTLVNLKDFLFEPKIDEVYEYYALKLLSDSDDWFFMDWTAESKNYSGLVPTKLTDEIHAFYFLFRKLRSHFKHWIKMKSHLLEFIDSSDYKYYPKNKIEL